MVDSFLVRILIYGMVGFVPGTNGTTIILPGVQGHEAYIAYDATCVGAQCKSITPFDDSFPGFILTSEQILIGGITNSDRVHGSLASSPPSKNLPDLPAESTKLHWIPQMVKVLKGTGNTGQINPLCLDTNPKNCGLPLKGRAHFATGQILSTCQLIANEGASEGADRVYAFDFKKNFTGPSNWKQGLTEIVELVSKEKGSEIVLELKGFSGSTRKVTLKPQPCDEVGPAMCVDIYIANIPKASFEPILQFKGIHFPLLYRLLKTPPTKEFAPVADMAISKKANDIQPACRSVVTAARVSAVTLSKASPQVRLRARAFQAGSDFYLMSPETRPICPMAMFGPAEQ